MRRCIQFCGVFLILLLAVCMGQTSGPSTRPASAPSSGPAGKTVTLADDGSARMPVMVVADAPPAEQKAGDELVKYLSQATGARFLLARPPGTSRGRLIVGAKAARMCGIRAPVEDLSADGIVIRTVGTDIVLVGKTPHGTLNAAYTFLEDCVGCRWYTPAFSVVPKKPKLTIEPLDVHYSPVFEHREPYFPTTSSDADWSLRNKCNGPSAKWDDKLGGKISYAGFVHTFNQLIPPDKYFKKHPEWFGLINGKREPQSQLCLTNEEMRRELVRNLKALLRKNPSAVIASVSQNDLEANCQCEKCAAIEAAEESPSGLVLTFVNAVADDIKPQLPKVYIDTLAYMYTRKPPKTVKPHGNVIIRYCTIKAAINKPLTDPLNQEFDEDLAGWGKICDRIYVWDYVSTFFCTMLPSQNVHVLGPNVRYFADHNVKGVFEEGSSTEGTHLAELKAWVLAKLLWNHKLDDKKLVDEFVQAYYGPAAKEVREYIRVFDDSAAESLDKITCFTQWTAPHISIQNMTAAWQHIQAARAAAKDDPDVSDRLEPLELALEYEWIMGWVWMNKQAEELLLPWPVKETPQEMYDRFMELAKKHNVTKVDDFGKDLKELDVGLKRAIAYEQGKKPTTKPQK